ncbi:release factor glutamine methyltransferase [Thermotomaculum hydrothermale]|uniref:Release factor glutamine methyltransferase n=1 Tax=Thermotomaculum hydrothermale TaxID=981385 RepID=A0A7R6SY25_9BACT|nr:peptide chain release factor N(5)-glutamine methyltransferase [Thermotomaculum hydrothermale]BBB32185.1 release factor glutamine methyltransferase [Thermotomaculum hydrothermale]
MKRKFLKYIDSLKKKGIKEPLLEIQRFISEKFSIPLVDVITGDFEFTPEIAKELETFVKKRADGIPYAYILGFTHFWGRKFFVSPDVLIPRPETEVIVDFVLKKFGNGFKGKILDCCTGSGNIAISLALEMPEAVVFASDISIKALNIARKNAENLNANISLINCDKLNCLKAHSIDIILANPPYIGLSEKYSLEREVLNEPHIALFGGDKGYEFLEEFLNKAVLIVKEKGIIVFEIGYNQRKEVESLTREIFKKSDIYFLKDLNGHFRVGVIENA